MGVVGDYAFPGKGARAGPALSGNAGGRNQGLAMEPLGGAGGGPRGQHLVAARRAAAARRAKFAAPRERPEGPGAAVPGARRRTRRSRLPPRARVHDLNVAAVISRAIEMDL